MKTMQMSLSLTKVGKVELKKVSDNIFSAARYILVDYSVLLGVGEENGTCARVAEAGPSDRPSVRGSFTGHSRRGKAASKFVISNILATQSYFLFNIYILLDEMKRR